MEPSSKQTEIYEKIVKFNRIIRPVFAAFNKSKETVKKKVAFFGRILYNLICVQRVDHPMKHRKTKVSAFSSVGRAVDS